MLLAVALAFLVVSPAAAQPLEVTDCWTETSIGVRGDEISVTACLVEGSLEITYYYESGERPPVLPDVNVGYDALGTECWWKTSADTPWVKLAEYSDGHALVGYHPYGSPGTVLESLIRGCTSQPRETDNTLAAAWELANRHVHHLPEPAFNPDLGVTGLETYLAVAVPDPVTDSLISPLGTTVTVEIKVARVIVDWGDGRVDDFTESTHPHLTGYPDGIARHTYETKTCPTPGGPRCHATLSAYEIQVEFDWFVRWRVDAGPWSAIAVPNTTTLVTYDVDEIVTRSVAIP